MDGIDCDRPLASRRRKLNDELRNKSDTVELIHGVVDEIISRIPQIKGAETTGSTMKEPTLIEGDILLDPKYFDLSSVSDTDSQGNGDPKKTPVESRSLRPLAARQLWVKKINADTKQGETTSNGSIDRNINTNTPSLVMSSETKKLSVVRKSKIDAKKLVRIILLAFFGSYAGEALK